MDCKSVHIWAESMGAYHETAMAQTPHDEHSSGKDDDEETYVLDALGRRCAGVHYCACSASSSRKYLREECSCGYEYINTAQEESESQ